MNRNYFWKWALVAFVVAWAFFELYPPTSRNLVDEFTITAAQKDATFNAIVAEARKLEVERPNRSYQNLRAAIGTNDIRPYFPGVKAPEGSNPTLVVLNRLQKEAAGQMKLGLDLRGGTSFLVGVDLEHKSSQTDTNGVPLVSESDIDKVAVLEQAIEVLRKRVDQFGVAEPLIQPSGENRILIQLPGLSEEDIVTMRSTIERAAFLEFRLVHPESARYVEQGLVPPGHVRMLLRHTDREGREQISHVIVKRNTEKGLTGKYVSRAMVIRDPISNKPTISLRFDSEGARMFAEITRDNVGRSLAIVLDGELYSAPVINEPIPSGEAVISGSFTLKEAFELANVLENPLEAPVKVLSQGVVDPSLGQDSINSGVRAAFIGVILVAAFMLVYYLYAGLVANAALILNIIILLGVLCAIDATLTLPGIAGVVLTIGMAVDANVLIYERIREELAAGKSLRGAVNAGYGKAFSTIFDSNLTTLIASVILIFMGTGPVKGFGVTLTIGVCVSMFTALMVTRLMFDAAIDRGWITKLPMMQFVKGSKIDFLRYAKPAFIASWALIAVGLAYGLHRGGDVMGVDFAGGDALSLKYDKQIEVADVRKAIEATGLTDALVQYQSGAENVLAITVPFEKGAGVEAALVKTFPDAKFTRLSLDTVGPVIGAEIMKSAIAAALLALFGILVYVAMRYEFSFAVGAVVAVVHDLLMTLGWFFLSGRELSAPIVAAVLTIIGFSINDTIVIFDRVREDLLLGRRGNFKELMNHALNQTLSRTIITAGTVFLSTLSLYMFGGGVINDFAFTFLVGILTGTYSSIFIACALVLWWHKGERPKNMIANPVVVDGQSIPV